MKKNYEQFYALVILYGVANFSILEWGGLYLSFETLYKDKILNTVSSDTNKLNLRIFSCMKGFVTCRTSPYVSWECIYLRYRT